MILSDFKTQTHGKWILAGEHAVIRGYGALVFPLKDHVLDLQYTYTNKALSIDSKDVHGRVSEAFIHQALSYGFHAINQPISDIKGHFKITNHIPVSVGMGASAALSVALTRWFIHQKFIAQEQCYKFAKSIEDLFHGKSSGLDVAGVTNASGIYFQRGSYSSITPSWQPEFLLSPGGATGITSFCIKKVKSLWVKNAEIGHQIDQQMQQAVLLAKESLINHTTDSLNCLAKAMSQAEDCFFKWGLITPEMNHQIESLKKAGALAVKPTGSGGGGLLLSLWKNKARPVDNATIVTV